MSASMHYTQECPTCGRMLSINVRLIGRQVACQHCRAEFTATHMAPPVPHEPAATSALLRRADELLRQTDHVVRQ